MGRFGSGFYLRSRGGTRPMALVCVDRDLGDEFADTFWLVG